MAWQDDFTDEQYDIIYNHYGAVYWRNADDFWNYEFRNHSSINNLAKFAALPRKPPLTAGNFAILTKTQATMFIKDTPAFWTWYNWNKKWIFPIGYKFTSEAAVVIDAYFKGFQEEEPIEVPEEPPPDYDDDFIGDVKDWTVQKIGAAVAILDAKIAEIPAKIATEISEAWDWMGDLVVNMNNWIVEMVNKLVEFKDAMVNSLENAFAELQGFFERIGEQMKIAIEGVVDKLKAIGNTVFEWIKDLGNAIKDALVDAFQWLKENIISVIGDVWNWIKDLGTKIKDALVDAYQFLRDKFADFTEVLKTAFNWIKEGIVTAITKVVEWIKNAFNAIVEKILSLADAMGVIFDDLFERFQEWFEDALKPDKEKMVAFITGIFEAQREALEQITKSEVKGV